MKILDLTDQDLVNLRRTLYLTIMSSVSFEECAHKITKLKIPDGYELELCNMLGEWASYLVFIVTAFVCLLPVSLSVSPSLSVSLILLVAYSYNYSHSFASILLHYFLYICPSVECCSNERSYLRYYGLLGQRFCMMQVRIEACVARYCALLHCTILHYSKLVDIIRYDTILCYTMLRCFSMD